MTNEATSRVRETKEEREFVRNRAMAQIQGLMTLDLPSKDFVRIARKSLIQLLADYEEGALPDAPKGA